jgi:hypothetical protein
MRDSGLRDVANLWAVMTVIAIALFVVWVVLK